MKTGRLNTILWIAILLLFLNSADPILAQDEPPAAPASAAIQADITPVIGYQGRLMEAGAPVTGTRTMTFRLYQSLTGGTPDWVETKVVTISSGLFQTALGDTEPFEFYTYYLSKQLWLEVEVNGVVMPRQRLMGAPYALTLAPGAFIDGSEDYSLLGVQNRANGPGILSTSSTGPGVLGESGSGVGVFGYSAFGIAIKADGGGSGLNNAALKVNASKPDSVAISGKNNSTDATLVIENFGTGPLLKAFGDDAVDGDQEFQILNDGTVQQEPSASGLVKAGVLLYCSASDPIRYRYFNNAGGEIIVSGGSTVGDCYVDFGFNLNYRYWVVDAVNEYPPFQHCKLDPGNFNRLLCTIRNYTGAPYSGGTITILVY